MHVYTFLWEGYHYAFYFESIAEIQGTTFFFFLTEEAFLNEMWNIFIIAKPVQFPQWNPTTILLKGRKLHIAPLGILILQWRPQVQTIMTASHIPPEGHIVSHPEQHHASLCKCNYAAAMLVQLNLFLGFFTFHPKTFITSNDWNQSPAYVLDLGNKHLGGVPKSFVISRKVESNFTHIH